MTPFQLAGGGDPQSELAMCQRYYYRTTGNGDSIRLSPLGGVPTTSILDVVLSLPVTMRTTISALDTANLDVFMNNSAARYSGGTFTLLAGMPNNPTVRYTHTSAAFTVGWNGFILQNGATAGYLGFSAEL